MVCCRPYRRHATTDSRVGLGYFRPILYRYTIVNPNVGSLDWIIDPFAREYGVGKLSAFTLGYQPYVWSAAEDNWQTPALADLVVYEINIAELVGGFERTSRLMAYLSDLGVNAVEIMPLSNSGVPIDWGYLPIGYFGVDERFGRRSDFQQMVDVAHQHDIAVIVDVVYGHTASIFRTATRTRDCNTTKICLWGPLRKTTSVISARAQISDGRLPATTFTA